MRRCLACLQTWRPQPRGPSILQAGGSPSLGLAPPLCLVQGHPIFYGKGSEAAGWFDRLGFACPFGVNIADWILDLASGEVAGVKKCAPALAAAGARCTSGPLGWWSP